MTPHNFAEVRFQNTTRLKRFFLRPSWFYRTLGFTLLYAFWIWGVRLLTLTFITYFTISPTAHFQDISEAFGSNEVTLMGLAALLFILLIKGLNPLTTSRATEILNRDQVEKSFLPGFVQGGFLAGGLIIAFLLSGAYRYLGYFIQFEEAPIEWLNVLLRMAALGCLAYCEEFIFRESLVVKMGEPPSNWFFQVAQANWIAFLYCGIKLLQFDLGWMHLATLYLIAISLYFRSKIHHFSKGAGFWTAILIVFHPLLSLPIFGNDFSGILLVKYQPVTKSWISSELIRFLSGGAGGPISSFAFQLLLILDIGRSIWKRRKK